MKKLFRRLLRWKWSISEQGWNLVTLRGRSVATVYPDGIWHTWDSDGIGGENSMCQYAEMMAFENRQYAAKREAWKSCIRQGFI